MSNHQQISLRFRNISISSFLCLLLLFFGFSQNLKARNIQLFSLSLMEVKNRDTIAFVSVSDIYRYSEHPDSLAIPDLTDESPEHASDFECLQLSNQYRNRLLTNCHISNNEQLFIYSYYTNKIVSIPIRELPAVALMNIYGADWPYSQFDFMIGFEIDKILLKELASNFEQSFVYIGKKNPFAMHQLKPIVWEKTDTKLLSKFMPEKYDTSYAGVCVPGNAYKFHLNGRLFLMQDFFRIDDNFHAMKYLAVIDEKSNRIIFNRLFYSGESASFAGLEDQWTGKLLSNMPDVILNLQWFSFSCPEITYIHTSEKSIFTNCDCRH